jgi:hypothetical protein
MYSNSGWSNDSPNNETSPNNQQFQQIPPGQVSQSNNRFAPGKGRQSNGNGNRNWVPPAQKQPNPSAQPQQQQQMSQAPPGLNNTMVPPNMNQLPPPMVC